MSGSRRLRDAMVMVWLAMLLASTLAAGAAAQDDDPADPGPEPGAIGQPSMPLSQKRVYDMANLLNNDQEAWIESDARRLATFGVPAVVIIQPGVLSQAEAASFAADVRRDWAVETAPGADDGLIVLVTVDTTADAQSIQPRLLWGPGALPHFGITTATSETIQEQWLDRYVHDGNLYEGILYSLRRLIYHSIYDPAPQVAPTGLRSAVGTALSLVGPLLAIVAGIVAGRRWLRPASPIASSAPDAIALAWVIPATAVALAALAIWSQSGWGVSAALVLGVIAVTDWIRRDPRHRSDTGAAGSGWERAAS